MSDKRKRTEDHYGSRYKAPVMQQPIVVNHEQFGEVEQVQLNGALPTNSQSNLIYLILPPGANQSPNMLQGLQTVLLVPKEEQANSGDGPPQLHYFMPVNEKSSLECIPKEEGDGVFIKDLKDSEVEATDPLQIQVNNTMQDYTLVPQYEEPPFVVNNSQGENVTDPMRYKTQFKCDHPGCGRTFPSVYEKKIHAETHIFPENTEFKCTICNMSFDRAIDRNKHVDSHAVVNTYKCKTCDKSFPYYTTLVKHINEERCASSKSHSCSYCGVQFVDSFDLEKHQKENMRHCACRAKICSEQAFELHTSLCTLYKQRMGKQKGVPQNKRSLNASGNVIVLD